MDIMLERQLQGLKLHRKYIPRAFYVKDREVVVEWLCDLADKLRVQPETFHHCVNMFDAYLQRPDINDHLSSINYFRRSTK